MYVLAQSGQALRLFLKRTKNDVLPIWCATATPSAGLLTYMTASMGANNGTSANTNQRELRSLAVQPYADPGHGGSLVLDTDDDYELVRLGLYPRRVSARFKAACRP